MAWASSVATAAATVLGASVFALIRVGYLHRCKINELRKQGVPMPQEWSWFTGHLLVLQKFTQAIPPDAGVIYAMRNLAQEFTSEELFLMDFWPVFPAVMFLFGPGPSTQVTHKYNLPKIQTAARTMEPIAGGPNILSLNGAEWKYWRALFNPGFSAASMASNVSHIVDATLVFREKLVAKIENGVFLLDEYATSLTSDVILKVVLDDHDADSQRKPNALVNAMGQILHWHSFWNPFILLNPVRLVIQWYNGRIANQYIQNLLEKRFQEIKDQDQLGVINKSTPGTTKSIVSLAIKAYISEAESNGSEGESESKSESEFNGKGKSGRKPSLSVDQLDTRFASYVAQQVRIFMFAGTDSTASTLVYIFDMMSRHTSWTAKLRDEHNRVFGSDPSLAAERIRQEPSLLNQCILTTAFIKETLRLRSPGGSLRSGVPGAMVTSLNGNNYPMDYIGANILHQALHVNPRLWPRPMEFVPERFLVTDPDNELYPDSDAFRPFEYGSRNCIGQTLVWSELKIAVILTCRDLVIRDAYAELDARRDSHKTGIQRIKETIFGEPIRTLNGDRVYPTDTAGHHPVDGYPCYVDWVGCE